MKTSSQDIESMDSKNRSSRRILSLAGAIIFLVGVILSNAPVNAQTPEQLRQLQQLTPAQRSAILKAINEQKVVQQQPIPDSESGSETQRVARPIGDAITDAESDSDEDNERDLASQVMPDVARRGTSQLRHFGHDLFAGAPTTFAPATDIPIPVDYVIGPGDTIELQLFGNENALYSLVVTRDGVLNIPDIGPIPVVGLNFSELKAALQQRISDQMIGVKVSITMGRLRSIRIFILGNANRPGSYTISALSTMTNALLVSGGTNSIGSLRNVQLKRNGRVVQTLDLYDLLLHGDTSRDARLQPGDVIYIPPIGHTVGVDGEVRRPAIYELKAEKNVADVLKLAEGLRPTAYPQASKIERINEHRERTIIDVDLTTQQGLASEVRPDDTIRVYSVLEKREDIVHLSGHVYRSGSYQWRRGMRLTDLVGSTRDLQPKADPNYVLVRRESLSDLDIDVISADLSAAFVRPGSDADPLLQPRDQIIVFNLESGRSSMIEPILAELRLQSSHAEPVREVRIGGRVSAPGRYPLEPGMRISDLLRAGGHLDEAAYMLEAELARHTVEAGQHRETEIVDVNLAGILAGDTTADLALAPHDFLTIKQIPMWHDFETIEIDGEVHFPGSYPIKRGERLSSVLKRAAGLTDLAFPDGAIFLREELRRREKQQIQNLADRLEGDLTAASASNGDHVQSLTARRELLSQVRGTQATGRLVINLEQAISGGEDNSADILLRAGDRLLVPRKSQTITVIGEVQHPTSHVLQRGINHKGYIKMTGGMTPQADKKRIYIVRANGSVVPASGSRLFQGRKGLEVYAGDTIVIPVKADPVSRLTLWTSVTTIIYNIGIAAAAVASFAI